MRTLERVQAAWNPSLVIDGVVLTLYDERLSLGQQVVAEVRRFGCPLVEITGGDLKEGDTITEVNGTKVKQTRDLIDRVSVQAPGSKVELTLLREGKQVKMSTRKATFVTVDELVDEVGADALRFFFLMRKPDSMIEGRKKK